MPRYLRWITAITTGIIVQILVQIAFLGAVTAAGIKQLTGFSAALGTFAVLIVNVMTALGINEWLMKRYPVEDKPLARRP